MSSLAAIAPVSGHKGFIARRLDRIADHLNRAYIEPQKIAGCQVAVARHGQLAYFKSLGLMDRERNRPMRDDTIFRIYSMTKPITSIALMTLFERGLFRLDTPVEHFLPSWRDRRVWIKGSGEAMETVPAKRSITIRDLLCHMGGLTYGGGLQAEGPYHPVDECYRGLKIGTVGSRETMSGFVEKLAKVPLLYQPGERWAYSLASDVCGALVEIISGKPFAQYLREEIFAPLGMVDTDFHVPTEKLSRFAANYERRPDKTTRLIDDPEKSRYLQPDNFQSGGGGLVGTTADYLRFCDMLRRGGDCDGHRIISPATLALMRSNHLGQGRDLHDMAIGLFSETTYDGIGFGLGFAMTVDDVAAGSVSKGDFYWGGAASTIFWVDPGQDLVVIFMTQLMPSSTFDFRGQIKNIVYSALSEEG